MSTAEESPTQRAALPTFELDFGVDDADEPSEVTVFWPGADDVSTAWISVDAGHAVPIEEVA